MSPSCDDTKIGDAGRAQAEAALHPPSWGAGGAAARSLDAIRIVDEAIDWVLDDEGAAHDHQPLQVLNEKDRSQK